MSQVRISVIAPVIKEILSQDKGTTGFHHKFFVKNTYYCLSEQFSHIQTIDPIFFLNFLLREE